MILRKIHQCVECDNCSTDHFENYFEESRRDQRDQWLLRLVVGLVTLRRDLRLVSTRPR